MSVLMDDLYLGHIHAGWSTMQVELGTSSPRDQNSLQSKKHHFSIGAAEDFDYGYTAFTMGYV